MAAPFSAFEVRKLKFKRRNTVWTSPIYHFCMYLFVGWSVEFFSNISDANDGSFVTLLKEVKILQSVNTEFENANTSLKAKVKELETACKSVTEDVLLVKTDEERLRDEYRVLKRKILYTLSRVNLDSVGVKQSSYDFDGLINLLNMGFIKQTKKYEIVMKEIEKAMQLTDV